MSEIVPYCLVPTNLSELMEFSKMAASSSFVSAQMRGKPGDVLMAIQMGAEVGLNPLQAIQNIAVINSRPCLWGDAALAVVVRSSVYEYHRETHTGSIDDESRAAHCTVKRKGADEHTVTFSIADAKRAGLWKKNQVWTQYPDRMLQMRARAFAIRDQFADALKGLAVREEVEDYNTDKPKKESTMTLVELPKKTDEQILAEINIPRPDLMEMITNAKSLDDLKNAYAKAYQLHAGRLELMVDISMLKDHRKQQIEEYNKQMKEGTFEDPLPVMGE